MFEVHPEVCFWAMNSGKPVVAPKKTPAGVAERRRLLGVAFGDKTISAVLTNEGRRGAADDNVLDALAALWTASRIAKGEARMIPEKAEVDAAGLRMTIWY